MASWQKGGGQLPLPINFGLENCQKTFLWENFRAKMQDFGQNNLEKFKGKIKILSTHNHFSGKLLAVCRKIATFSPACFFKTVFALYYVLCTMFVCMRVDLSPRLGGHSWAPPTVERDRRPVEWPINPSPTTVLLSFTFILSPRRNGVRSHSRCGTES